MYYYKLTTTDEFGTAYEYVAANNESELNDTIQEFSADFINNPEVNVREVSVEECLQEEERVLEARLFGMYFKKYYDPDVITVREYSKLQKQFREDPAFRWQVLKEINRTERKV